jgi:hypothetical protein
VPFYRVGGGGGACGLCGNGGRRRWNFMWAVTGDEGGETGKGRRWVLSFLEGKGEVMS